MIIEDYAEYMIQKHVLAIALAVIKAKPANIAYETYIDRIRNKIIQTDMESNHDITLCEEDFNISDDFTHDDDDQTMRNDQSMMMNDQLNTSHDSVTILQNFNMHASDGRGENDDANSLLDVMTELGNIEEKSVNETLINDSQNHCTQSTNFDESQISMNVLCDKNNELANNMEMFYETYIESNQEVGNNSKEVIINKYHNDITNSNSANNATYINKDVGRITHNESNNFTKENKTIKENNNIDSQKTILYTLQGFTGNTHVSQSQDDFVIANRNLLKGSNTVLNSNKCDPIVTKNITNSQTFQHNARKVIQNGKEELVCNVYAGVIKENNRAIMDTSHNNIHFDANKNNVLDKIIIFNDDKAPRKSKNPHNNYDSGSKRIKTDANDKIYTKSSCSSCIPKHQSNDTKSYETDYDKNAEQDSATSSQNNNDNGTSQIHKETYNLTLGHTFRGSSNDLTEISQDIQNDHIDIANFEINTVDSIRTAQSLEFRFSPDESQSLLSSNEKGVNTSLEYIKLNDNDRHNIENIYAHINTDSNNSAKEKDQKTSKLKENPIILDKLTNFDDPIIKLSQNVKHKSNYKTNGFISTDTHDEMKAISDFKESCRLKENNFVVLNNLPDDGTKDVYHQKKITREYIPDDNPNENDLSDNDADTQSETVSFKTLEELNRIKSYLNKRDRRFSEGNNSLDSGFKSSQPRTSYKSASQHSEVWINESAHSLLSFITVSQLADSTTEIADEISRILGKLIDKLHEEEKYPNFLEEFLDKVNALLNDVYQGNNGEFNGLLKRDDTIYRLLLLNRSKHIINYTIEKIILILDETNNYLTDDVFELKDVTRTENLCHIFHILEVVLKRVKRKSDESQTSVQNEGGVLKRNSLTEIWRKKWNFTKSEVIGGSSKEKCVLIKCSEVLNRIIVKAMDGYSLVSFAALQCFNILQN